MARGLSDPPPHAGLVPDPADVADLIVRRGWRLHNLEMMEREKYDTLIGVLGPTNCKLMSHNILVVAGKPFIKCELLISPLGKQNLKRWWDEKQAAERLEDKKEEKS